MAELIAGDKTYVIPDLNFVALELAWPYVQEATVAVTPISGISASIMVIAAGLITKEDFDPKDFEIPEEITSVKTQHAMIGVFLKRKIRAKDAGAVKDTFMQVLEEAGLEVSEGELLQILEEVKGMVANPSTGTAQATSSSSSPQDAKGGAGKR